MLEENEKDKELYKFLQRNKISRYDILKRLTLKIKNNLHQTIFLEDIIKEFAIKNNDLTIICKLGEIIFHSDKNENDAKITNDLNRLKNDGYIIIYPKSIKDKNSLTQIKKEEQGIKITEKGLEKLEEIHMSMEEMAKHKQPANYMALDEAKKSNEIALEANTIAHESKNEAKTANNISWLGACMAVISLVIAALAFMNKI